MKKPKIYVSYAWKDDNSPDREKIVDELEEAMKAHGLDLIRDKNGGVGYGESIRKFMQAIGQGDIIVVVLSEKYLKSEYCMYEVLEMMRNRNYLDKVLPIVLPDANIFGLTGRAQYIKYWKDEYAKTLDAIKTLGEDDVPESFIKKRKLYYTIKDSIDDFADSISDINSLTPEMLSENNFKDIINQIQIRTNTNNISTEKVKLDFGKKLHLFIDRVKQEKQFERIQSTKGLFQPHIFISHGYKNDMHQSLVERFKVLIEKESDTSIVDYHFKYWPEKEQTFEFEIKKAFVEHKKLKEIPGAKRSVDDILNANIFVNSSRLKNQSLVFEFTFSAEDWHKESMNHLNWFAENLIMS